MIFKASIWILGSFEESALNYMVSGFMSGDNFIFSLNLNDEEDRVLTI